MLCLGNAVLRRDEIEMASDALKEFRSVTLGGRTAIPVSKSVQLPIDDHSNITDRRYNGIIIVLPVLFVLLHLVMQPTG